MSINEIKRMLVKKLESHGYDKSRVSVESRIVGYYDYVVVVIKNPDIPKEQIEDIVACRGIEIDNYPGRSWDDFCKVRTFDERNNIR